MHTFLVFFGWPLGAIWGNLLASVLVAVWVTVQARSVKAVQAELREAHERHHAEHMDALNLDTPGGLAAVYGAVRDAKTAAESAHGAVQGLALVTSPPPAAGATRMRKTAAGKAEQAPAGMGSRIPPKTPKGKT